MGKRSRHEEMDANFEAPRSGLPPREQAFLLILILALETWIFSGAFHKFFTHDSLFYMTNLAHSWKEFLPFLLGPSQEMSYRPVNLAVASILAPFLGVESRPWHWVPLLFHLTNTILFYLLGRRILPGTTAALAAAAFWGLHAVAGWVTYDITYLSDFLPAFLLLVTILLAIEGQKRKSLPVMAASLAAFVLSLMTKEAATTFPLAIWLSLVLADLRTSAGPITRKRVAAALGRSLPFIAALVVMDFLFVGLFSYWLVSGRIYAQGTTSAYDIAPFANLSGKAKYLYWALNLPDDLYIPNGARTRALALASMAVPLLLWGLDILRRRCRLSFTEWAGVLWFVGLNVPSLLLSQRLAKWYLYLPLLGLALAFGVCAENLRSLASRGWRRLAGYAILPLLIAPIVFSSRAQTRSYVARSDSAYQSDFLDSCLSDFRKAHPTLPSEATLFFLPAFEEGVSALLSSDPIGHGELFQMYYPGTKISARFAHLGDPLPYDIGKRTDVIVLQYLDRQLHDVTEHFKSSPRMTLFVLPTREREIPPLLKKVPAGGSKHYEEFVQLAFADQGAQLPADYPARQDLWIIQYLGSRFTDVTSYYKGRHASKGRRVAPDLQAIRYTVSHSELYPDYEHFDTPTGAPVFFQTPENDILTQVGGSILTVSLEKIPPDAQLRFDISWMYEEGDGGWAEAVIRARGKETLVHREYLKAKPKPSSLIWKEVRFNLRAFEGEETELILKCYNNRTGNTVADWLNWRNISIEPAGPSSSK